MINPIHYQPNQGRSYARSQGVQNAQGDILLFIDSDVVIDPQTITKIATYFEENEDIAAVTGLLSKEHPYPNFFSQYKNLYMHYTFMKLPDRVNFLYGSIHAIRKHVISGYNTNVQVADDTEMGQMLSRSGHASDF